MELEQLKEDILEAIQGLATHMDERFVGVDKKFASIDQQFIKIDKRFERLELRMDKSDARLNKIEATMVTKDYLDDKLANLRGDLVYLTRKEDHKLTTLVDILRNREVISDADADQVLSLEPFSHKP